MRIERHYAEIVQDGSGGSRTGKQIVATFQPSRASVGEEAVIGNVCDSNPVVTNGSDLPERKALPYRQPYFCLKTGHSAP